MCKGEAYLHLYQLLLSPACPSLVHGQRKRGPEEARTLQGLHSPRKLDTSDGPFQALLHPLGLAPSFVGPSIECRLF